MGPGRALDALPCGARKSPKKDDGREDRGRVERGASGRPGWSTRRTRSGDGLVEDGQRGASLSTANHGRRRGVGDASSGHRVTTVLGPRTGGGQRHRDPASFLVATRQLKTVEQPWPPSDALRSPRPAAAIHVGGVGIGRPTMRSSAGTVLVIVPTTRLTSAGERHLHPMSARGASW